MAKVDQIIYGNAMRIAQEKGWDKKQFAEKLHSNVRTLDNYKGREIQIRIVLRTVTGDHTDLYKRQ